MTIHPCPHCSSMSIDLTHVPTCRRCGRYELSVDRWNVAALTAQVERLKSERVGAQSNGRYLVPDARILADPPECRHCYDTKQVTQRLTAPCPRCVKPEAGSCRLCRGSKSINVCSRCGFPECFTGTFYCEPDKVPTTEQMPCPRCVGGGSCPNQNMLCNDGRKACRWCAERSTKRDQDNASRSTKTEQGT